MARIYISSTYWDLKDERKAVINTLRRLVDFHIEVVGMEDYAATDERPVDKCTGDVKTCDLYVGILAWRYGYVPDGYQKSITHMEYEAATDANIPRLLFLLDESIGWPKDRYGKGSDLERFF